MTDERTKDCPFPETARTGASFISPCCTAGTIEFLIDGQYWLCGQVAGHGWSKPRLGRVTDINDDGTLCQPGQPDRYIRWNPARDPKYQVRYVGTGGTHHFLKQTGPRTYIWTLDRAEAHGFDYPAQGEAAARTTGQDMARVTTHRINP